MREGAKTRWCFTLNNWTQEEIKSLEDSLVPICQYTVWGKEIGQNQTPHLQGFFILRTRLRLTTLKTKVPGLQRAHLEAARGTNDQASEYCKKDQNFFETGSLPTQGLDRMGKKAMQEMLLAAKAAIDEGVSMHQLWEDHFLAMANNTRALREYWTLKNSQEERVKPRVEVLWGAPGTGKTRYCHDVARIFFDNDVWIYAGGGWFDGYCGQKVCIFDDFYGDVPLGLFLKVLDRYKCMVPVKGSFVNWNPVRIYITSNRPPLSWYSDLQDFQKFALLRRFDKIEEVLENVYE